MNLKLLMLAVVTVIAFFGVTSTASAHSLTATQKMHAKKTYYHSVGYINAIWKNARRTVYHPDHAKREKWLKALAFLKHQREAAWKKLHPQPQRSPIPGNLLSAFSCIHKYEGAWNANTGNGYYGGLQMDRRFQSLYGSDFVARWGTADNWPIYYQLVAAVRAYKAGRGFYPWPNTARACGLI